MLYTIKDRLSNEYVSDNSFNDSPIVTRLEAEKAFATFKNEVHAAKTPGYWQLERHEWGDFQVLSAFDTRSLYNS